MSLLYQYRTYGKKLTGYGAVEGLVRTHFIEVDTDEEPAPLRFGELHCLLSHLGPTENFHCAISRMSVARQWGEISADFSSSAWCHTLPIGRYLTPLYGWFSCISSSS